MKEGKLRVLGAVYDLQTGKVRWLGVHPGQAALLHGGAASHGEVAPAAAKNAEAEHTPEKAEPVKHAEPAAKHEEPVKKKAEPSHGGGH